MRILIATKSHLPAIGGSEISTHYLAATLTHRGHKVTIFTGRRRRSVNGAREMLVRRLIREPRARLDAEYGYPIFGTIFPGEAFGSFMRLCKPDIVIVTATDPRLARRTLAQVGDVPTMVYVRDVASRGLGRDRKMHFDAFVANSRFVAEEVSKTGVECKFIPSLFPLERYRVDTTCGRVLFVNPIEKKGAEIAWALAERRPDIPFVFVPSWNLTLRAKAILYLRARKHPNVEIRRSSLSPLSLFGDCGLVLVPSIYPEAWSRIASEAQASGIPVLGARLGGIPEAVGPGGILVEPSAPIDEWLIALSLLWDDRDAHMRYSRLARKHSERPEMSVDSVANRFEALMRKAIASHSLCRTSPGDAGDVVT